MDHLDAPYVVLGAGAVGSAAAYHLARRGEPIVLVEQFGLGHDRGSSHGLARITRHSYADERYARLMIEAFGAWRALEADAGECLYVRTGGVSVCPPGVDYVARVAANLEAIGVPHRRMTGRDLRRIHPLFALPEDADVVFEPDAGLIAAARAVAVQVGLARRLGGAATRVVEGCPIRRIDLDADRPTLVADDVRITAERLIVAAGAWMGKLLPELAGRLRPERQQVLYFRPDDPAAFAVGRFPAYIYKGAAPEDAFYGMPDFLGGGVKFAHHGGPDVDPDAVDRALDPGGVDPVRDFLRGHIPALAGAPIGHAEVCLYTMAPGEEFVVGPWPGRPDLIVASPCSGHGFKFSCLVGRILADYARSGRADLPVASWRPTPADSDQ